MAIAPAIPYKAGERFETTEKVKESARLYIKNDGRYDTIVVHLRCNAQTESRLLPARAIQWPQLASDLNRPAYGPRWPRSTPLAVPLISGAALFSARDRSDSGR